LDAAIPPFVVFALQDPAAFCINATVILSANLRSIVTAAMLRADDRSWSKRPARRRW